MAKLIVLDKNKHQFLRYRPIERYDFAKSFELIPITHSELPLLCCDFPIVVSSTAEGSHLLAIPGINRLGQSAIKGNGAFAGNYIPAFLRRYPFSLLSSKEGDAAVVAYESESGCFDSPSGKPLFDNEGNSTETMQQAIALLEGVQNEMNVTASILSLLSDHDILQPARFKVSNQEGEKVYEGFSRISKEKLSEMDDEFIAGAVRKGWMEMTELQNFSLR